MVCNVKWKARIKKVDKIVQKFGPGLEFTELKSSNPIDYSNLGFYDGFKPYDTEYSI
jgi:hypothetical protein